MQTFVCTNQRIHHAKRAQGKLSSARTQLMVHPTSYGDTTNLKVFF